MASAFKRQMTGRWMACWTDGQGRARQSTCTGSKADALRMARRLEREAQVGGQVRAGHDRFESFWVTPIAENVEAYLASLRYKRRHESHIGQMRSILTKVFGAAGVITLRDLDSVVVSEAINELTKSRRKFETATTVPAVLSDRTKSNYGVRVRSFGKWLVKVGRTQHNVLAGVDTVGGSAIRVVHGRRALSRGEVTQLLDAALQRPVEEARIIRRGARVGQPLARVSPECLERLQRGGMERRTIYLLAVWTGLRRREIQDLRWSDCHLGVERPYIQLRAEATKSKRADRVPLHPEVVAQLHQWKEQSSTRPAGNAPELDSVFEHLPSMVTFKSDLRRAGIPYDSAGRGVVDFHALRKTYSTLMAAANLPARIRQSAMRHSTPDLTETTYMDESHLPVYEHVAGMEPFGD